MPDARKDGWVFVAGDGFTGHGPWVHFGKSFLKPRENLDDAVAMQMIEDMNSAGLASATDRLHRLGPSAGRALPPITRSAERGGGARVAATMRPHGARRRTGSYGSLLLS
jgi:hypothetical protein